MDRFLEEQISGQIDGPRGFFTLNTAHSRETILAARTKLDRATILARIDAAVIESGFDALKLVKMTRLHDRISLLVALPNFGRSRIDAFLDELRQPFSCKPGVTHLAQVALLASKSNWIVNIYLSGWPQLNPTLCLQEDSLDVPSSLSASRDELKLTFFGGMTESPFQKYRDSPLGKGILSRCDDLLPLESPCRSTDGFFDYRTKPFTAIRSYAAGEPGLRFDLWKGPYQQLDSQTVALNRREPGRFLFLTWRPDYGNPTFLHHSLDSPLAFGRQSCQGIFWVASSDRPAQVRFLSPPLISVPVPVNGPAGLNGLVFWPGLTFDTWGCQAVKNSVFEKAMAWTQNHVTATAQTLSTHLDHVLARLRDGNTVKSKGYTEETVQRVQQLWGR